MIAKEFIGGVGLGTKLLSLDKVRHMFVYHSGISKLFVSLLKFSLDHVINYLNACRST